MTASSNVQGGNSWFSGALSTVASFAASALTLSSADAEHPAKTSSSRGSGDSGHRMPSISAMVRSVDEITTSGGFGGGEWDGGRNAAALLVTEDAFEGLDGTGVASQATRSGSTNRRGNDASLPRASSRKNGMGPKQESGNASDNDEIAFDDDQQKLAVLELQAAVVLW